MSKREIYCVYVVEDYGAKSIIISVTNGIKIVVDIPEAKLLAVELIDTLEVEDLGIDLTNKEIYQLIDKANEAKYYYDQAKN